MVCYANAAGNTNARRTSRAKHYVVFDRAEDNSAALRAPLLPALSLFLVSQEI